MQYSTVLHGNDAPLCKLTGMLHCVLDDRNLIPVCTHSASVMFSHTDALTISTNRKRISILTITCPCWYYLLGNSPMLKYYNSYAVKMINCVHILN